MTQPSTRILVTGAGYAGLLFTMRLAGKVARQDVQISLVNESDTFTERPRLHQFATNQVVQWRSIPQMLRRTNVQFIQGRVTSLDPIHRRIIVEDQQQTHQLEYDYLVNALGSETDRKTVPGVAQYAYTLAARGPLSAAALRETLPSIEARGGQVVVSGGGATGIETAAEVARYQGEPGHARVSGSLPGQERGQIYPAFTAAPGSRDYRSNQCDSRARTERCHRSRERACLRPVHLDGRFCGSAAGKGSRFGRE